MCFSLSPDEIDEALTYKSFMQRPDCARYLAGAPCPMNESKEQLALLTLLRETDHWREWHSLSDSRVCVLCDRSFTGHDVAVEILDGVLRLSCPTPGCRSRIHFWAYPGNPLLSEAVFDDWWRALDPTPTQHVAASAA